MAPVKTLALAALLFGNVLSAPIKARQVAGEGQAADSILTEFDNGVGYGGEDAEDNLAALVTSVKSGGATAGGPSRRQVAGEGQAADSILTGFDNGVGYGGEDAEDNAAQLITNVKGGQGTTGGSSSGGGNPPPPPPPKKGPKSKRQLDKLAKGFGNLGDAVGVGAVADPTATEAEDLDGASTNDAAVAGAEIGQDEETDLEAVGSSVPTQLKMMARQLDKLSNGFATLGDAAGVGAVADPIAATGDSVDGTTTSGAANAGAAIGDAEVNTLETVGSSVPTNVKL